MNFDFGNEKNSDNNDKPESIDILSAENNLNLDVPEQSSESELDALLDGDTPIDDSILEDDQPFASEVTPEEISVEEPILEQVTLEEPTAELSDEVPADEEEFNPMDESEEFVVEESTDEESAKEVPVLEEPVDEIPVEDEPVLEEPVDEIPVEDEPVSPLVACLTDLALRKVRTPEGEQEFALGELIDVETGEALNLTALIPEDLFATVAASTAPGFVMGGTTPSMGGFDMSAGEETSEAGTKRKKRAPKPKSEKKKGGVGGIFIGGLLALIIFPYALWLIEYTTGAHSNIPVPAPGITSTYKYIPKWWPDWAMFCFPGRTAENSTPSDDDAKPADKPVQDNAADPVEKDDQNNPEEASDENADAENPVDNADVAKAEADKANADSEDFDPDAFMANDEAKPVPEENADQPAEEPAKEEAKPAEEPVKEEVAKAEPGLANAPTYTAQDVSDAITAVGTAFKATKKIDDNVYNALSDMAEKSTFVDTSNVDDQLKDCMVKVGKAMENFGTKAVLAAALSEKLAVRAKDVQDNAGILFVGKLSSVTQRDGYQIGLVEVEGQDGLTVEVVGLRKIKPVAGDRIVVCGKRIAEPTKNLGGFSDNGVPVIWGGKIIKAEAK